MATKSSAKVAAHAAVKEDLKKTAAAQKIKWNVFFRRVGAVMLSVLTLVSLASCFLLGADVLTHRDYICSNPYLESQNFKIELSNFLYNLNSNIKEAAGGSFVFRDYIDANQQSELQEKLIEAEPMVKYSTSSFFYYRLINEDQTVIWQNPADFTPGEDVAKTLEYPMPQKSSISSEYPSSQSTDINTTLNDMNCRLTVYVVPNGRLATDLNYSESIHQRILKEVALFFILLVVSIALSYSLVKAFRPADFLFSNPTSIRVRHFFCKFPPDLFLLLIFLLYRLSVQHLHSVFIVPITIDHFLYFSLTMLAVFLTCAYLFYEYALYLNALTKVHWKNSLVYHAGHLVYDALCGVSLNKQLTFMTLFLLAFTGIWGYICIALVLSRNFLGFFLLLLYICIPLPITLRYISQLNRIMKDTEEMASGNLDASIYIPGHGVLSRFASSINNIRSGLKTSVDQAVKSERMRSELITNVSHDLKTPLTSIISYVTLLQQADLTEEERYKYLKIIDQKAARLKILIDDLFEASKMSSGAVELDISRVNVSDLLLQALGEYDERLQTSTLEFRTDIESPHLYAYLDGRKTWRVFSNLITNALKYSLDNTRVYLTLKEQGDWIYFTIKNISAYEMDFSPDEIFERFKRGDKSRNTEGSGLGLAISKSIMELQGGDMRIEIDGDLFKITAMFPKTINQLKA